MYSAEFFYYTGKQVTTFARAAENKSYTETQIDLTAVSGRCIARRRLFTLSAAILLVPATAVAGTTLAQARFMNYEPFPSPLKGVGEMRAGKLPVALWNGNKAMLLFIFRLEPIH